MRIIPPSTEPPETAIKRRHTPPKAEGRYGYRTYRSCLRWEFGFSCAFCLLHESDFSSHGAERLGLMWIEHHITLSASKESANDYENCFYSCRLCNRDRSFAPIVDGQGRRLLNPCSDAWAEHFELVGDELRPLPGDADAGYTHAAYNLDDPRKVMMRRSRREVLTACLALFREGYPKIQALIESADPKGVSAARELRECVKLAAKQLERHIAIPKDAGDCRCERRSDPSLPKELETQTIVVRIPEL